MAAPRIAAVIPAYNVGAHLAAVLAELPSLFTSAIVVDDASADDTAAIAARCAAIDPRISVIRHDRNRGVGGAMISGFRKALADGADVIVKVDGDGQMPLEFAPRLIEPLLSGEADYAKGNRFRDFSAIRHMPAVRRLGNLGLGFLAKAATGYWHCFDPTNGFVAIRADVLAQIPLDDVDPTYFFEISMLTHLYLIGAAVKEEPMPARYGGEPSSLSIPRVLVDFPGRLLRSFLRRLILKNLVYEFGIESLQLLLGVPLLFAGLLYGGYEWFWYVHHNRAAPTGTIVLAALMIIIGFQSLVSAITLDLQSVPTRPINRGPIRAPEVSDR